MTSGILPILGIVIIIFMALVGTVYKSLSAKIDTKVDHDLYIKTISTIEKALEKINGAAATLERIGIEVRNIQTEFMTRKDFEYEMKIYQLSKDGKEKRSK